MQNTQLTCPHCGSTLTFGMQIAAGTPVSCLICMQAFAATNPIAVPAASPAPASTKTSASPLVKSAPARPKVTTTPKAETSTPSLRKPEEPTGSNPALLVFTIALLVLLTAGVGFGVWKMTAGKNPPIDEKGPIADNTKNDVNKKDNPDKKNPDNVDDPNKKKDPANQPGPNPANDTSKPKKLTKAEEDELSKQLEEEVKVLIRKNAAKPDVPPEPMPKPDPVKTVEVAPKFKVVGFDQKRVNDAIDKGIANLKRTQKANGAWHDGHEAGYASLGGLTFLECGVSPKDEHVQRAANLIRSTAGAIEGTYDLSASVLFLDRLGDPRDAPLIQGFAMRLLAGQKENGSWSYECPRLNAHEMYQLYGFLKAGKLPNALDPNGADPRMPAPPSGPDGLFKEFRRLIDSKAPVGTTDRFSIAVQNLPALRTYGITHAQRKQINYTGPGDNSNTQFAILALWAARRHGVPSDYALLAAAGYFAYTQNQDGGWGYSAGAVTSGGMTNVGLLALALEHGVMKDIDPKNATPALKNPRIHAGLLALSRYFGQPVADPDRTIFQVADLYFLWSAERVAVLYDLQTIGGKDWYSWGGQILIRTQSHDGDWLNSHYLSASPPASTCFALLFLKRSNLVQDLTQNLKLQTGIQNPK